MAGFVADVAHIKIFVAITSAIVEIVGFITAYLLPHILKFFEINA